MDVALGDVSLDRAGEFASKAEHIGAEGLWVFEQTHNPFLLMTEVASHTSRADIGTAIAVAFPRSPMVVAYTAWDLQSFSDGRFILGLGTQVKGQIERRFSTDWFSPGPRLRDYVNCLRSIWSSWANQEPVNYEGEFYSIDHCPPKFTPEPINVPEIPVFIGGVNEYNIQLAGEICDGLHLHPANSPRYIDQHVIPNLRKGAQKSDRSPDDVILSASCLAVTGSTDEEIDRTREQVRNMLAFWGSTRTYRKIFEVHGWGDICDPLHDLSLEGKWEKMNDLITDEMVAAMSVEGPWEELRNRLDERYDHLDRVALFTPYRGESHWETMFR